MPAYVIVEVTVTNPTLYREYVHLTPDTIAGFGGRFIVRGGEAISLEGEWAPERIVVLEFPDVARAQEWWHSEQYTRARLIRQRAAETRMIIVPGFGARN